MYIIVMNATTAIFTTKPYGNEVSEHNIQIYENTKVISITLEDEIGFLSRGHKHGLPCLQFYQWGKNYSDTLGPRIH